VPLNSLSCFSVIFWCSHLCRGGCGVAWVSLVRLLFTVGTSTKLPLRSFTMMNDGLVRRPGEYSPKSSPRGNRSPVVSRPDSTGTLKTTISLRSTPAIVHSSQHGPFYLLKDNPTKSEQMLTGSTNMMLHYNLEHSFNKFIGRKVKDKLSAFLPSLPGNIDIPASSDQGDSSLRKVINQPPVGGKELIPLSGAQLAGFRLHPGPLPEQYRSANSQALKRKKHKRHKQEGPPVASGMPAGGGPVPTPEGFAETEKKHKKPKKHDEDRKKRKKDKKKKKRHSPEPPNAIGGPNTPLAGTPLSNRVTI